MNENTKKRKIQQTFNTKGFAEIEGRSNKRQRFVQQRLDEGELKIIPADHDNSSDMQGDLFTKLRNERKLELMTNFTEAQLRDLWLGLSKFVTATKKRGPPPSITYLDSLAGSLSVAYTTLRDAVVRIRPLLHSALVERWWEKRRRPVAGEGEDCHIALLVDSNSQHIYRPKACFDEAKILFDAKNCIYAWKKEVAVMAAPPYYALFVSPKFAGSAEDTRRETAT